MDRNTSNNIVWTASDVLIAFAIMGVILFGFNIIMPVIAFVPTQQSDNYGLSLMLSAGIIYLINKYPLHMYDYGFHGDGIKKTLAWGFGGGILLSAINFPLRSIAKGEAWIDFEKFMGSNNDTFSIVLFLIFSCLLIPVMEEVFFRGCVYRILKNRYDVILATIITCGVFAVFHWNFVFALYSYVLITLYERSSFLGSSILAHVIWNSSWYLSIYFFKAVIV